MQITPTYRDTFSQHFDVLMPDGKSVKVIYNTLEGWSAVLKVNSLRSSYTYTKHVSKHRAIEAAKALGVELPQPSKWVAA
jgi:hypothetical protein